jgi:hypothetical protein
LIEFVIAIRQLREEAEPGRSGAAPYYPRQGETIFRPATYLRQLSRLAHNLRARSAIIGPISAPKLNAAGGVD